MLAANMDPRSQKTAHLASAEEPRRTTKQSAADPNQLVIKIEDASVLAMREEEEEDIDADADFDDDEIESELEDVDDVTPPGPQTLQPGNKGFATPPNDLPLPTTPRTPKRTLDEMAVEVEVELAETQEVPREGTPPKRARLGDAPPSTVPSVSPSPIRHRKRSSEEREDDSIAVQSNGKRVKA